MTRAEYELFLQVAAVICAGAAIFNLFLIRRRGASGGVMAIAFLVLGFTILAYQREGQSTAVTVGGSIVVLLLMADVVIRSAKPRK